MVNAPANIPSLLRHARPEVVSAIRKASEKTGVDFSYLVQNAAAESSLNPSAHSAASSARGLFQFIDSTWLDTVDKHGPEHGLGKAAAAITRDSNGKPVVHDAAVRRQILAMRDNPAIAAMMAAEFTKDNKTTLESTLGRKVDNGELYMAHFLGASGAGKVISKKEEAPGALASQLLPNAAMANHSVFFAAGKALSVNELYGKLASNFANESELAGPVVAAVSTIAMPDANAALALALTGVKPAHNQAESNTVNSPYGMQAFTLELFKSLSLPGKDALTGKHWKA